MQNENWQVRISREPGSMGGMVFIYRRSGESVQVMHFNQNGESTVTTSKIGDALAPTMRFQYEEDLRGVIAAFMIEGAAFGVKAPDQSFAEGKLEAISEHLSDMRKIVFEPSINGKQI